MSSIRQPRAFESSDEIVGRIELRARFFIALHGVEPRVAGSLASDVLPAYREAATERARQSGAADLFILWAADLHPQWSTINRDRRTTTAADRTLRADIQAWAKRWGITDDWIIQAAVETVARVVAVHGDHAAARLVTEPIWHPSTAMVRLPLRDEEQRFEFGRRSHLGWNPTLETWHAFEEKLDATMGWISRGVDYDRAKRDYRQRIEKICRDRGLALVLQPRVRLEGADHDLHLTWLARYQIERESFNEIRREPGPALEPVTVNAVRLAVRAMAGDLGLTLRAAGRPGRPRKKQLAT